MLQLLLLACAESADTAESDDSKSTTLEACAAADLFPTLTANPANSAYADRTLEAGCDGDELVVRSNGIPWFEFVPLTPNALMEQDQEWRIPLEPVAADEPTTLNLLGSDAFSLVGLVVNTPNEAEFPDPYGDPVYNGIVDACYGHTGFGGEYHFHALDVECSTMVAPASDLPSPIVGYALDGYPVYGPMGCLDTTCAELVELESGWVQTGDPTTYAWDAYAYAGSTEANVLDECNGRTQPDGTYGYHATAGFPYVLGCYHGVIELADEGETQPPPEEEVIDCADAEAGMPCCGDDVCDGPETADNCVVDCA